VSFPRVGPFQGTGEEWDRVVREDPEHTAFHLSGWKGVISDGMGHDFEGLEAREDGVLVGILPLYRVRSRIFGDYLLSMPFLNYGGPLGTAAARAALVQGAVERARGAGVDLLELRVAHPLEGDLAVSQRKVTVLLPLPEDPVHFWEKGIKAKVRSQIRRPMKEGMETRFGPHELEPFYRVFSQNMRDLGTPVLPRSFFQGVRQHLGDAVRFGVVYHQGEPVAAGCGFRWSDTFEITWASSLREFNSLAPNMLLYWRFLEKMIEEGVRTFDFGRCTPGGGTHRFKLQWGGVDHPLPWAQWAPGGVAATPSPDRPIFQLATSVWQKLPLAVANRVGPLLSRSLP